MAIGAPSTSPLRVSSLSLSLTTFFKYFHTSTARGTSISGIRVFLCVFPERYRAQTRSTLLYADLSTQTRDRITETDRVRESEWSWSGERSGREGLCFCELKIQLSTLRLRASLALVPRGGLPRGCGVLRRAQRSLALRARRHSAPPRVDCGPRLNAIRTAILPATGGTPRLPTSCPHHAG